MFVSRGFTGAQVFANWKGIVDPDVPDPTHTNLENSGHWTWIHDGSNLAQGYCSVEVESGTVGVACFTKKAGHSTVATLDDLDLYDQGTWNGVTSTCSTPGSGTPFWICVWTPSGANANIVNYHNTHAPQAAYPVNFVLTQVGNSWFIQCDTTAVGAFLHWGTGTSGRASLDCPNCVTGSMVNGKWTFAIDVTAIHGQYAKFLCRGSEGYPFYPSSVVSFHC